ncbi:MAG TPA: hypothetical protein VJ732_13495, partial [Bryobacteraceae bacterium]|nr:hypothetical protein [Bryobacteraceae bacterium]
MSATDRMLGVIESVYDAATDENLWPEALRKLAEFTASQAATFWVLDGSETPRLPVFTFLNFDPSAVREYLETTAALDPTVQYLVRHPDQTIVHDGLIQITEREKARHPYYDWHERRIETRFRLVGQISPAPRIQAGVALHRTARAGRFEPSDVRQFAVLHRHLERALTLAFRLGSLGALQQGAAELLDRNPAAVLLLDRSGRVVYANAAAERLRAAADGIGFSQSGITAAAGRENAALEALIADALSAARSPARCGGILRVSRPSGRRSYVVLVSPLSRN